MSAAMIGRRFGRLKVLSKVLKGDFTGIRWRCVCDCGNTINAFANNLYRGHTASCGCLRKEVTSLRNGSHRMSQLRVYRIWAGIKARCNNPNTISYPRYGAIGIRVCKKWSDSFESFYKDMGDPPTTRHTIERKNTRGHYRKSNCCWATYKEQARNTRRTRIIRFLGRSLSLAQHCEEQGLAYATVHARLRLGWPINKAFTQQVRSY